MTIGGLLLLKEEEIRHALVTNFIGSGKFLHKIQNYKFKF